MDTSDLLFSDPVKERLCLELSWNDLANLVVSKDFQSFPCRKRVNDQDENIFEFSQINNSTIALARYIEAVGSRTALSYLILNDNPKLVRMLLETGMEFDPDKPINLSYAVLTNLEMVQLLLEFGASPLPKGGMPNLVAAQADVRSSKLATYEFDPVRIQEFIASKRNDARFISKPLFAAIWNNPDVEIVKLLLEKGAPINDTHRDRVGLNSSPLYLAILKRKDYPEILQLVLESGADVDFRREGFTLLETALQFNDIGLFKLLLKYQPDTSTEIRNRLVFLLLGSDDNFSGLQQLLRKGVNLEYLNSQNPSFLFVAMKNNAFKNTELLLKYGVDPNILSYVPIPNTAPHKYSYVLHFAVHQKSLRFIDLLLKYGANPYRNDDSNVSAFDMAMDPRLISIPVLNLFRKHGLRVSPFYLYYYLQKSLTQDLVKIVKDQLYSDILQAIIPLTEDLNRKDKNGLTSLDLFDILVKEERRMIIYDEIKIAKLMIAQGAQFSINYLNNYVEGVPNLHDLIDLPASVLRSNIDLPRNPGRSLSPQPSELPFVRFRPSSPSRLNIV